MILVKYTYNEVDEDIKKKECRGGDFSSSSIYVRNGAMSEISVSDGKIREKIKGTEGIFRDVTSDISDVRKVTHGDNFLYLITKNYVYAVKRDSYVQGTEEELYKELSDRKKAIKISKDDHKEKKEQYRNTDYWKEIRKQNAEADGESLSEKFRMPIIFSVAFVVLTIINILDPFQNHFSGTVLGTGTVFSVVAAAIIGFAMGFVYVFFRIWFDDQKESVRVGSIILFPFTILIFLLIAVIGFIPYSIYLIVKGNNAELFGNVVKKSVKILSVLFGALFIFLIILVIFLP